MEVCYIQLFICAENKELQTNGPRLLAKTIR